MNGLKKILTMSSIAVASAVAPLPSQSQETQQVKASAVQQVQNISASRVVNETGYPNFTDILKNQLQLMAQNTVGSAVLRDLPDTVNFVIQEKPPYAEEAGFFDGKNCVIYDDTLLAGFMGSASVLMAHEGRHAIQSSKYERDYTQMPTEQQIVYNKMIEMETRLQDVLMKEDFYQRKFASMQEQQTPDWMDYRRLKASIQKDNPQLPAEKIERMARTQFVVDSWQGNYKRETYDQRDDNRTFRDWTKIYNEKCLQGANKRCLMMRPVPSLKVDESKVARHHEIMQEYIERMGIDVPPDFFDDLKQDKSMRVVRDSQELAAIGKHLEKELKLVVMPKDDFVRVGGIAIGKDNSTEMFSPEKRKEFEKEIQAVFLAKKAKQETR